MSLFDKRTTIDLYVWNHLVETTYNKPYHFQQQNGCRDRGVYEVDINYAEDIERTTIPEELNGDEMGVSFKAWLERGIDEWNGADEDKRFIKLFWHRNFYPSVDIIAQDLFDRGIITEKSFDIVVDW